MHPDTGGRRHVCAWDRRHIRRVAVTMRGPEGGTPLRGLHRGGTLSRHAATVTWSRETPDFSYDTFDRTHRVAYESGHALVASSAPDFKGDGSKVNPEEAFVGALSSCHMLTFLAVAARKRLVVDRYADAAEGWVEKNEAGKLAMTRVTLRPKVTWAPGTTVDADTLAKLHDTAHANCFIAQSVTSAVAIEPA